MYLNETCCKVCIGKHLFPVFPIHIGSKEEVLSSLLFSFALGQAVGRD